MFFVAFEFEIVGLGRRRLLKTLLLDEKWSIGSDKEERDEEEEEENLR